MLGIGALVNCMVAAEQFRTAMEKASSELIPLDEAEQTALGFKILQFLSFRGALRAEGSSYPGF